VIKAGREGEDAYGERPRRTALPPVRSPADGGDAVTAPGLNRPDPVLTVRGLAKRFGTLDAIRDLSFDLHAGEVLAVVGENGSGKTTLLKLITGALAPDRGTIRLDGRPLPPGNPSAARNRGIEAIYQDLALAENMDAADNVFLGRLQKRRLFGLVPVIDRTGMRAATQDRLDDLGLGLEPDRMALPVNSLSGGERQAIALARALMLRPKLLLMDEPTAALSPTRRRRVTNTIRRLAADGIAILLVSHDPDEIRDAADRILVLRSGAFETGSPAPAFTPSRGEDDARA
jgi:ABC-type sugar transport system ATPase subunit